MRIKLFAKIPPDMSEEEIQWLLIEDDYDESGGVFLFCLHKLTEESIDDEWYEDIDKAKEAAFLKWHIPIDQWSKFENGTDP